jgi:hypothetical protein
MNMLVSFIVGVLWIAAGIAYIIWSIDTQFKKTKTAKMPPQVWWEFLIVWPCYALITLLCFLYAAGCALLFCVTFDKIDIGDL